VYYLFRLTQKVTAERITGFILAVLILLIIKFYILFAMIPGALTVIFIRAFPRLNKWFAAAVVHLVIITLFFNTSLFSRYDLPAIISAKQKDFVNMINATENVGSRIDIPVLEPTVVSFVKNSPVALFDVFFRPLPGDLHSVIMIPAFFENLLIWVLILITAVFFCIKIPREHIPLILFCLSFVLVLFILTGLTTPVIGAMVRYKAPALPFLFVLLFLLTDKDKILRYLPKRKKK